MGLLNQVKYPAAVLVNVDIGQPKPLRILFGAPPEVSRRLKADQKPGPDGKPVNNFPDVVVCPGVRVVHDTPTLCPEFILFASAFLGGRYNWADMCMTSPLRWVGTTDELDDVMSVMKECFLGVDDKQLRNRVRSNRAVREMLLNDGRFFAVQSKQGTPHPLTHFCEMHPYDGEHSVTLAEGVRIVDHRDDHTFIVEFKGESLVVNIDYEGIDTPMWADRYPIPEAPLQPSLFGITVLGSDSAFSISGPTTTNLLSLGGEFFLWDCSPFTAWLLTRLGISIGDIRGIFVSHIHDDHVVDLYKFAWNGYRKIELITTVEVKEQVLRKFSALWGVDREAVESAFDWRLIQPFKPFLINGVSIRTHYGAHPIPSLGARFEYGEHCFGVTGDTSSRGGPVGLDKQLEKGLITAERHEFISTFPSKQFTLCDAGEATIHGFVKDFEAFDTTQIALAHRSDIPDPFKDKLQLAGPLFARHFRAANQTVQDASIVGEIMTLLGSRLAHWTNKFLQGQQPRSIKCGEVLVRQGDTKPDFVFMILAGTAEVTNDGRRVAMLDKGNFFGEQSFIRHAPRSATVTAFSPMRVLPVPGALFMQFLKEDAEEAGRFDRISVKDRLERTWANRDLIANAFSNRLAPTSVHMLAGLTEVIRVAAGSPIQSSSHDRDEILVVAEGQIEVLTSPTRMLSVGDVLGDMQLNGKRGRILPAVARTAAALLRVPLVPFERLLHNAPAFRRHVEDHLARQGQRLRLSREVHV